MNIPTHIVDKLGYFFEHRMGRELPETSRHTRMAIPDNEVLLETSIDPITGARLVVSVPVTTLACLLFLDTDTVRAVEEGTITDEELKAKFEEDIPGAPGVAYTTPVDWEALIEGDTNGTLGFRRFFEAWDTEAEEQKGTKPAPPIGTQPSKSQRRWNSPPANQPLDDGPEDNADLKASGRVSGRVTHGKRDAARARRRG